MGRILAAIFILAVIFAGTFIALTDMLMPSPRYMPVQAVQEEQTSLPVLGETSGGTTIKDGVFYPGWTP